MKTIKYFITIFMLSWVFTSFIPKNFQQKRTIIIECKTSDVSKQNLEKTRDIIKTRFKHYGRKSVKVKLLNNNRLAVKVPNKYPQATVSRLVSGRGKLEFYECKENSKALKTIKQKLDKEQQKKLFYLLTVEKASSLFNPILGRANATDTAKINQLLNENFRSNENMQLFWGEKDAQNNTFPLYGLNASPFTGREELKDVEIIFSTTHSSSQIQLSFNETGKQIWLKITQRNLNKALAVVIDQKVYFAPIVRDKIKGGVIMILGRFTEDQTNMLYALLKAKELPVNFRVVD